MGTVHCALCIVQCECKIIHCEVHDNGKTPGGQMLLVQVRAAIHGYKQNLEPVLYPSRSAQIKRANSFVLSFLLC